MEHRIFTSFPSASNQTDSSVRIISLGGTGNVTKNMYVYEYRVGSTLTDILIVDCGIGFPEPEMYGIDILLPDTRYLHDKKQYIRGVVFTHGHDDHIGAIPYLYTQLGAPPLYATKLTSAFINTKLKEVNIKNKAKVVSFDDTVVLGAFRLSFIHMTHSVPDSASVIIDTPIGTFYHASDYKFDFTPLDGNGPDMQKINRISEKGVLCLLTDSLGTERRGFTQSEKAIEDTIEREMSLCSGKFLFTTQSSNISRIELVVKIAHTHHKRVAFVGRSIDQNIQAASEIGLVHFPQHLILSEKEAAKEKPQSVCLIVAGSQGQPDSALSRIAHDNHANIHIHEGDTVVFSADPIPGNEQNVNRLIDQLYRKGVRVSYSDITEDLHVSGHGSQGDLMLLLSCVSPTWVVPIGGTYRHMIQYRRLAQELGFPQNHIIIPQDGDILEWDRQGRMKIRGTLDLDNIMVDGLGIGDIGKVVLRDRQTIAQEGIVVIVIPVDQSTGRVTSEPDIISRGFVFMKESDEILKKAKRAVIQSMKLKKGKIIDWQYAKVTIIRNVERVLEKEIGRYPLIVPVIIEV